MGDAEEFILFIWIMAPLTPSAGTARNYLLTFLLRDNHRTNVRRDGQASRVSYLNISRGTGAG